MSYVWETATDILGFILILTIGIVRPANRDWACQTERCHTLSNKTILQYSL